MFDRDATIDQHFNRPDAFFSRGIVSPAYTRRNWIWVAAGTRIDVLYNMFPEKFTAYACPMIHHVNGLWIQTFVKVEENSWKLH